MTILRCHMCTATLHVIPHHNIITCEYCGTSKKLTQPGPPPGMHHHPAPMHAPGFAHGLPAQGFAKPFWTPYPRHNILIHIVLACATYGVGNVFYFLYVKHKQFRWQEMRNVHHMNEMRRLHHIRH